MTAPANLPLFPGIFPDQMEPIVRTGADGERELAMARWGMPGPAQYGGAPVTNIRNVRSPHWRGWLGRRNRCLVLRVRGRQAAQEAHLVRPW
jgi:putative SOS response-associated peptidase YedK